MSKPSNTTRPVCLTDGAILYYPQGAGIVRRIAVAALPFIGEDPDSIASLTAEVGLTCMALCEVTPGSVIARVLAPVNEAEPPARWTDPKDPLGFPEDFADLLGAWLDWCDEQEAAVEEAVAA